MKKISLTLLMAFMCIGSSFSQSKSTKSGFELEAAPFKMDNFSEKNSFSLSGYIGFYSEVGFTKQFTTKFSAGLNNIYFQKYSPVPNSIHSANSQGYNGGVPTEGDFMNTLQLTIEPRFYLFSSEKSWGNCYAALPVAIETAPLKNISRGNVKMTVIPSIGYKYNLSSHWAIEANTGLGWGKILQKESSSLFEYALQARIRYAF